MNGGIRDTVNIDETVHEIYKQLTEGNDPVAAPFKTMKDVFLWAACLGFRRGERKQIVGKKITIFRMAQFNATIDLPIVKAIALSTGELVHKIQDQDWLLTTIEEYANAGIGEINPLSLNGFSNNLFQLIDHINNNEGLK